MNKRLKLLIVPLGLAVIFYCCSEDSVTPKIPETNDNYVKVVTAENGNIKFEVWSATASELRACYNKIGFKVYENNQEKTTGFVKYFPKMYHWQGSPMHSTPVKAQCNYVDSLHMFTGYVVYTMTSDTASFWYGFYNYNNEIYLDSAFFTVAQYPQGQIKAFSDYVAGVGYLITLITPDSPGQGLNTFQCMLHKTIDYINFDQVDNAQMQIMPWMVSMGHGSTGNVHPVYIGDGVYEGKVNFNMPGEWYVYDSVYVDGRKITPNIPPKFTFNP